MLAKARENYQFKRMNPEWKAKWVEWLRDPENKQGVGGLRNYDNEFCCLGGLCQIFDPSGWTNRPPPEQGWIHRYAYKGNATAFPPTDLCIEVGLDEFALSTLVGKNDNGRPFSEIADWIEENL